MAGSAAKSVTDADPARSEADAAGPIELDELYLRGVTLAGEPVVSLVVRTADGGVHKLRPPAVVGGSAGNGKLTDLEAKVIRLFAGLEPATKLIGKEVANVLDEPPGTVGRALADLARKKMLANDGGGSGYYRGPRFPSSLQ